MAAVQPLYYKCGIRPVILKSIIRLIQTAAPDLAYHGHHSLAYSYCTRLTVQDSQMAKMINI